MRPSFFIIGAPKTGTTSLASYLADHDCVYFSPNKEPNFFASDIFRDRRRVHTETAYLQLFEAAGKQHRAVGEGSTWYLCSERALPDILARWPDAKFIAMIRNPVDMAYALHEQNLFDYSEDVVDFPKAWELQAQRAAGKHIPATCDGPKTLQYSWRCSVGEQIERFFALVPPAQRRVFLFDDFKQSPGDIYRHTLEFLGLPDDGRQDFSILNPSKRHRSTLVKNLAMLSQQPPKSLERIKNLLKSTLGVRSFGLSRALNRFNSKQNLRTSPRPPLSAEWRQRLESHFSADVARLENALGVDLRKRWNWSIQS